MTAGTRRAGNKLIRAPSSPRGRAGGGPIRRYVSARRSVLNRTDATVHIRLDMGFK